MLCVKCHEREATVHLTVIDGDKVTKRDFCEECAGPYIPDKNVYGARPDCYIGPPPAARPGVIFSSEEFLKIRTLCRRKSIEAAHGGTACYPMDAYRFVKEALYACLKGAHVSADVLLDSIRELALKKFGKRAKAILAGWNVFRTEDFGEIVFEMIDAELLSKQPEDSKEDFKNGFNFDEAFPES